MLVNTDSRRISVRLGRVLDRTSTIIWSDERNDTHLESSRGLQCPTGSLLQSHCHRSRRQRIRRMQLQCNRWKIGRWSCEHVDIVSQHQRGSVHVVAKVVISSLWLGILLYVLICDADERCSDHRRNPRNPIVWSQRGPSEDEESDGFQEDDVAQPPQAGLRRD